MNNEFDLKDEFRKSGLNNFFYTENSCDMIVMIDAKNYFFYRKRTIMLN